MTDLEVHVDLDETRSTGWQDGQAPPVVLAPGDCYILLNLEIVEGDDDGVSIGEAELHVSGLEPALVAPLLRAVAGSMTPAP